MGALIGINVFLVLIGGTVISIIIGVATGAIPWMDIFQAIASGPDGSSGVTGMYDITVISIVVACIVAIVKYNGGIAWILQFIRRRIKSQKGAQLGIAGLTLLVDMATANNTVAIVIAGPIAKEISNQYGIAPKRSASLLDIFASVGQGLIPYGAQLLLAAEITGVTPFKMMPYLYYPILMAVSAVCFIVFGKKNV